MAWGVASGGGVAVGTGEGVAVGVAVGAGVARSWGGSGSNRSALCGDRTGTPELRRVTFGVTALIRSAGLRSASDTTATITGVIAVAISVPRSQIIGTIPAAATAAAAEMASVWMEMPLFSFSIPP